MHRLELAAEKMIPSADGKCTIKIHQEEQAIAQGETKHQILLDFPEDLSYEKKQQHSNIINLGTSPSSRQFAGEKNDISCALPSTNQSSFSRIVSFIRKTDRASLCQLIKEWIRNPKNMAIFIWILCVATTSNIMSMIFVGMLDAVLPRKSQRDGWFEANSQILNALFTLMCLYIHPKRLYHLVLLAQWKPGGVLKLRKTYCKNGTCKPNERLHMMVVVVLLNLNCFSQYALESLYIGYTREQRPLIGLFVLLAFAYVTAAFAFVYEMMSPLGKEYDAGNVQEAGKQPASPDQKALFTERNPLWVGGLCSLRDDASIVFMSVFCSFCVFGWNMQRLGFGNMYVHIATFFLFCVAPFFIFNLAAINIDNEVVQQALGISGVLLCFLGLMYGGFWRIQMRRRFKLPEYSFCCGNPSFADCIQWLCCCSFALAQEVRTANYYDVAEHKCYSRDRSGDENFQISPLCCLHRPTLFGNSAPSKNMIEPTSAKCPGRCEVANPLYEMEEDDFLKISIEPMKPPISPLIIREEVSIP